MLPGLAGRREGDGDSIFPHEVFYGLISVRSLTTELVSAKLTRTTISQVMRQYLEFCQATKSHRWMIGRLKAMKDVVSCDKPRGAANKL